MRKLEEQKYFWRWSVGLAAGGSGSSSRIHSGRDTLCPLPSPPFTQLQVPAAAKLLHHPPLRIAKLFSRAGKLLLDLVLVWRRPPQWLLRPNLLPTHLFATFPVHLQRLAPSGRRCCVLPASHSRQSPPPPANAAICGQLDPVHAPQALQAQRGGSALSPNETCPERRKPPRKRSSDLGATAAAVRVPPCPLVAAGYLCLGLESDTQVIAAALVLACLYVRYHTAPRRHQLPTRLPRLPVQQPSH